MAYFGESLAGGPTDGISNMKFSTSSDSLLVSSWDTTVRLYDVGGSSWRAVYPHQAPVLDCCFNADNSNIFTGGLDCQVYMYDAATGAQFVLGSHAKPVKSVIHLMDQGLTVTGSWDGTVIAWDPRSRQYTAVLRLPGKVYTMDSVATRLVVGCSARHICIYDVRRLQYGQEEQRRESSLKYQTRCVACYPDGRGYAVGSVEGRVAMEYFDSAPEVQALKYAFKCHRTTENGKDTVFPVNTLSFHVGFGTFASGGGDGVVNIWDGTNKKRLHQISRYPTSISSLAFNRVGTLLAIASSYTYEYGEKEHVQDEIFLRKMQDSEVRPKPRR